MSFVEKNKAWLLPLLAVGVLGVVYLNIRTMTAAPTPPAPPSAESEPNPAIPVEGASPEVAPAEPGADAPPPVMADSQAPARPGADPGLDLWADLRGLAAAPPYLADENTFRDLARRSALDAIRSQPRPGILTVPSGVREPLPPVEAGEKSGGKANQPPSQVPELDFLIHGATGSRAWLEGKSYRVGQTLEGNLLSVGPIRATTVVLKGPSGKTQTILSTNPLHPPEPSARPAVEAP